MSSQTVESLEDLKTLSYKLSQELEIPQLVLLKGDLAVGKTQLVKYILEALKKDSSVVSSPSFSLINSYSFEEGFDIYHIDLYRLKSDEELKEIGFWDLFYKKALIFIEWPEKVEKELPVLWNKLWVEACFLDKKRVFQWKQEKSI